MIAHIFGHHAETLISAADENSLGLNYTTQHRLPSQKVKEAITARSSAEVGDPGDQNWEDL